jgi:DNA repair protein RecN (Recombination protein N)
MLKELYIENLAIIEKAVITFDRRLNVFSGETGAGKSILIGGINAVLGGRVSKDIVRGGAQKAVVTALFEIGDDCHELLLTREISCSGNSIARINSKTATAFDLKEIAAELIDVHGQHETRLITSREVQLAMIDEFAGICKTEYEGAFREFSTVCKKIKQLEKHEAVKNEKIEILSEKINECLPYKLKKGEEEEVSRELNRLRNIQDISEMLNRAYNSLNGDGEQFGAVDLLNISKVSLNEAAKYVIECKPLKERVDGLVIELDDIKREIAPLIGDNFAPERLTQLEERMSDFQRLKRKYALDTDELIDSISTWQSELDELQSQDAALQKLVDERRRLGDSVKSLAGEITQKRKTAADELSRLICRELEYLDMPGVRIVFELSQDKVTICGMDCVEMLIAANQGEQPKSMAKIASGGELSRIMLAIKVVQAARKQAAQGLSFYNGSFNGSLVFDEIDSGISGRAAHKVGLKLAELSAKRQVLCVTHLAQIAAMADNHLLIEKAVDGGRTYASVKSITGEQRERELARIISGDDDELSLANAQRLINRR